MAMRMRASRSRRAGIVMYDAAHAPCPRSRPTELVALRLPPHLEGLRRLAYNLYWAWHPEVRELFSRIDAAGLGSLPQSRRRAARGLRDWTALLDNEDFMGDYQEVLGQLRRLHGQRQRPLVPTPSPATTCDGPVAYFCAEYGLHETLGTLLGRPGRARRRPLQDRLRHGPALRGRGPLLPPRLLPPDDRRRRPPGARLPRLRSTRAARSARHRRGRRGRCWSRSSCPAASSSAAVWRVAVGRVPLLLLDTDIAENAPEDRPITHILYVRGREMRLHQEIVLGRGRRPRAARAGHPARGVAPQRGPLGLPARGAPARADRPAASPSRTPLAARPARTPSFTIHTPVAAGNERFEADLVRRLAAAPGRLGGDRPRAHPRARAAAWTAIPPSST